MMSERALLWGSLAGIALLAACLFVWGVPLTDGEGRRLTVQDGVASLAVEGVRQDELRAMVKGSIYETGELVSVFGTCLNASDEGIVGTSGTLSAWYPNGTQAVFNVSMSQMQAGYFVYIANMSAVQGTYLTEFTCHVNASNVTAKAFGEWQNPLWVSRINATQGAVQNLSNSTQQWFNITWDKIDSVNTTVNTTFTNLTSQLQYVVLVANGSVDRNDSYLAYLLQLIAAATGAPVNRTLTVTETADAPVINKMWRINVSVVNEYNVTVGAPVVGCFINTTNSPPTVGQGMTAHQVSGVSYFDWQEKVKATTFSWAAWCVYN